jgi:protein TonB
MRRSAIISIAVHGAAMAVLLGAGLSESAPPKLAPAIAVSLAPIPTVPQPVPVEQPKPEPAPKPVAKPTPPKPVAKPAPPAPVNAPSLVNAPAPVTEPAAESAPPAAPPAATAVAPAATTPDARWLAAVRARLEAAKRYPPAALRRRDEGTATITIEVAHDGQVLSHALTRSSGSSLLDREALDLPERVSPLPAMPDTMAQSKVTLVIPVSFALR